MDALGVTKEYTVRKSQFWDEVIRHLQLAFGALLIALVVGFFLAVYSHHRPKMRQVILHILSMFQTIPSLALFGLLMAPLGYLASHSSVAHAMGVRGIGGFPALVALVIYSLLPIVANTILGLGQVPKEVRDAAIGMGMTKWQLLFRIEIPLAFPIILTSVRVVLVQAIGLVTVAALIGGGGLGTFVFKGLGQTATDLVLLGAIPIVILAFSVAVILDALAEMSSTTGAKGH